MATLAEPLPADIAVHTAPDASPRRLAYRHPLSRRINHWINVVTVILLLMSGLNILEAHPALYWGKYGADADHPALAVMGANDKGTLTVGHHKFDTTGLLGWSGGEERVFPDLWTLPHQRDLAAARNWHLFLGWVLILNGLAYFGFSLFNRHLQRDILPNARDLAPANIAHDIRDHVRFKFPKGRDSNRYHVLQKLAYASLALVFLPGMVITGLSLSPGADAVFPGIVDLLGGRQPARTLHFIFMGLTVGFIVVHVALVLLAGFFKQIRAMITGWWAFDDDGVDPGQPTTLAGRIER